MGAQCLAQTLPKCDDHAHLFQLGSGINGRLGLGRHPAQPQLQMQGCAPRFSRLLTSPTHLPSDVSAALLVPASKPNAAALCHECDPPPLWVLDTNVVLDWLLFGDAAMQAPGELLLAGKACWIATAAMRDEALEVATRPVFRKRGSAPDLRHRVAAGFARHAQLQTDAPRMDAIAQGLRCSDADDQMFIDLALHHAAQMLLTRDQALLALASAASARGLRILRPKDFAAAAAAAAADTTARAP